MLPTGRGAQRTRGRTISGRIVSAEEAEYNENTRVAAEAEKTRVAAEAEKTRVAAQEEAARLEAARIAQENAAQEEAARLAEVQRFIQEREEDIQRNPYLRGQARKTRPVLGAVEDKFSQRRQSNDPRFNGMIFANTAQNIPGLLNNVGGARKKKKYTQTRTRQKKQHRHRRRRHSTRKHKK